MATLAMAVVLATSAGGGRVAGRAPFVLMAVAWTILAVSDARRGGPQLCMWWSLLLAAALFDAVAIGEYFNWNITAADRKSMESLYEAPWWINVWLEVHAPARLVRTMWQAIQNAAIWWSLVGACAWAMWMFGRRPMATFASVRLFDMPVVMLFTLPRSAPCQVQFAIDESLEAEYAGRVEFCYAEQGEDDAADDLARRFAITAWPTLLLIDTSAAETRIEGACERERLCRAIDRLVPEHL
ncbi:MAG: thioredoxin family protein [Planctomycetota bacterium]